MRNARRHGTIALICGLLACLAGSTEARAANSASQVNAAGTLTKPDADGKQTLTLTLKINDGWHLYANPVGNDTLTDAETKVTVGAKDKPEVIRIDYPAGKSIKDKVVGDYRIYEGTVTIKAQLRRAKGDTSPLDVTVAVQACNDKGSCLLPGKVKLTVP